ncbi:MAG TPA: hypothetical protein VGK84_12775 [Candidatus Tumulicola sp.]|jgi:hypothetical protein
MKGITVALCLVIALVGCSHPFTGRVDFQAPHGWTHSNDPTAGETWIKPDGSNQSIMAQTANAPLPPREPGWKDIQICGHHPAVLMFQRNDSGQLWEGVSTNWNGHRYMVVYARPASTPADPAAEAAIRTICLKRN